MLALRDVRVRRGDLLLEPVTFTADAGQVILIEGPSGAGKSSLLAALRGAAPFEGTATLGSEPLGSPASWLAWAGQQPGLITGTIADNVALGADHPDGTLIARALDISCADDLDPDAELGVQGAGLSGGQAQRVAVARAVYRYLSGAASVLAVDEPSAALDAETEARLWGRLRELADAGATILLVSHRTSARAIADEVVALQPQGVTA